MSNLENFPNIRTGVIGVGSMGQNHARIYKKISNLVAVADVDKIQGPKVAKRFGIKWFSDYREMLAEVDAVTIAVPTSFHKEVAIEVANAGVHMLVEKPLASNSVDAEYIVKAAKSSNVTLAVGHVERHNPVVSYSKEALNKGQWGEVISISSKRVSNFPKRIHDVGVLFDLLIHDIDICSYLLSNYPNSVYAVGGSRKAKHEDYVILTMRNAKNIISTCEANWLTPMKIRKLGITTSTNYIELDYQRQSVEIFSSEYIEVDEKDLYSSSLEFSSNFIPIDKKEPLLMELVDFLQSITLCREPLVSGQDGLNVVKVSEGALKSLGNQKVIDLNI